MTDIDSTIAMIKSRRDAAQVAMVRAQTISETAQASEDAARAKLREEFGLDNLAEARAKLEQLQSELQNILDAIATELDAMEL